MLPSALQEDRNALFEINRQSITINFSAGFISVE